MSQVHRCPIYGNPKAKIVWKRKDGKVIGMKCHRSHKHKNARAYRKCK